MKILVVNTGSSSLKFGLFDEDTLAEHASGIVDWAAEREKAVLSISTREGGPESRGVEAQGFKEAFDLVLDTLASRSLVTRGGGSVAGVGHRVVHGGSRFRETTEIGTEALEEIRRLSELAPLHNPPAVEAIEAAREALPDAAHYAVFDTSYFSTLPPRAHVYPLPYRWYSEWGIRRYGFHGISHAYSYRRASVLLGRGPEGLRVVSLHLGNGCSAAASAGGTAVATTMGFTPADGLMMGTRPGSVDPGILTYVGIEKGLSLEEMEDAVNHGSGLLGVSGVSSDLRKVEEAARAGNGRAALAIEIYADRARAAAASLAAAMGGLDALVFTAGVGENSPEMRARVSSGLEFMGLRLDPGKNEASRPDCDISKPGDGPRILVVRAREEEMIAREVKRLLRGG